MASPFNFLHRPPIPSKCDGMLQYRAMPGGVVVAHGTLDPMTQVRILAGQPLFRITPFIVSDLPSFFRYYVYDRQFKGLLSSQRNPGAKSMCKRT